MQTRREALKHSAAVAGLMAATGLFPNYAQAFDKAAFDAKSIAEAVKAMGGAAP
jgi:sulfur-oxidizing protein SoxY